MVEITSGMPSELTAFELSKLDLLDRNRRSLPPCFQDVTVAPNRLRFSSIHLNAWIGAREAVLSDGPIDTNRP